MEVVNKVGIPENKVVECLKYIELLGHIMYFPGEHIFFNDQIGYFAFY